MNSGCCCIKFVEQTYRNPHCSAPVIPSLCLGLSLSSPHLPPDQLDYFMKRMLVSRISRRVLAEHHIALSDKLAGRSAESPGGEPHVGIIFTGLDVKRSVNKCAWLLRERPHYLEDGFTQGMEGLEWPKVIVAGHVETEFSYIREHLESVLDSFPFVSFVDFFRYVVFELLKNVRSVCDPRDLY
jgi:pyruvate dehydrogenase kinase 2/3/4